MPDSSAIWPQEGERIAKTLARAGVCSRRDAERLIQDGRVSVNGKRLDTAAFKVTPKDVIKVDGKRIEAAERTRMWRYHKPQGLVTTHRDPQGRPTVFEHLPEDLPRVISVGRLDLNSEGLLLLTNDGEVARALELPTTGWVRRYRARAFGRVTQEQLDELRDGIEVDGVRYGSIIAKLEQGDKSNVWIAVSLTEGKNREVRRVLEAIGLKVNRLIRIGYGPFQLGNLAEGKVEEISPRILKEQLGGKLKKADPGDEKAGAKTAKASKPPRGRPGRPGKPGSGNKAAKDAKGPVRVGAPTKRRVR
jgi:23S rRNA pseudouridine2605 synthase